MSGGTSKQARGAVIGPHETEEHPQEGRLARAIGPEETVDFARAYDEVHVVDHSAIAVALRETNDFEGRLFRHAGSVSHEVGDLGEVSVVDRALDEAAYSPARIDEGLLGELGAALHAQGGQDARATGALR
jgi:hypothetical protein